MFANLSSQSRDKIIGTWLLLLGVMVYAMILIGGATRLTDSGLSITEWLPVSGVLPPLSTESWIAAFDLYKTTTEYKYQNFGMSLEEFKYIYWWEWVHRLFGRLIGIVAIVGLAFFWFRGWLAKEQKFHYSALVALGGLQGFIGWWMVASGIGETNRIDVAPYRLAVHFTLALVIIAYITVLWNSILISKTETFSPKAKISSTILLGLIFLQMASGALVAGLDAGRTYTDWPLINGELVPANYLEPSLGFRSVFEGIITAQFNHRIIAYVLLIVSLTVALTSRNQPLSGKFISLASMIFVQSLWGILTLVNAAPMGLALVHQGFGVWILVYATYLTAQSYGVGKPITLPSVSDRHL